MNEGEVSRRKVLYSVAAAGALAGCEGFGDDGSPGSQTTPTDAESGGTTGEEAVRDLTLAAETVADGFASPVDVAAPSSGELLVVDQVGTVTRVVEDDGTNEVVLDVRERMVDVSGYDERGLLGIALHPEYADGGRVFLRYSAPSREGTPTGYAHTFVLAEFEADPADGTIDPDSERTILEIPEPQRNHNAGPITFGPDGYLYVTVGDGGGANDQDDGHVADWYDEVDGGNGQDVTENLLGSVLRIDVDSETSETSREGGGGAADGSGEDGPAYAIPEDNPLVGEGGLDEHFAWGLRNPYGISFGPDGRGFVVDVGQGRFEEVNVLEEGANYGWNVREGEECFQAEDCPTETPDGEPLVDPIVAYPHDGQPVSGIAVVGGQRYDGDAIPPLDGSYVFGDWQADGRLFVAIEDGDAWNAQVVDVDDMGAFLLGTGLDADGEMLVLMSERGEVTGETGAVARLSGD